MKKLAVAFVAFSLSAVLVFPCSTDQCAGGVGFIGHVESNGARLAWTTGLEDTATTSFEIWLVVGGSESKWKTVQAYQDCTGHDYSYVYETPLSLTYRLKLLSGTTVLCSYDWHQ